METEGHVSLCEQSNSELYLWSKACAYHSHTAKGTTAFYFIPFSLYFNLV